MRAKRLPDDYDDDETTEIFFLVDVGEVIYKVNKRQCYKNPPQDLMYRSKFTVRCHLSNVKPPDDAFPNEWVGSDAAKCFNEILRRTNGLVNILVRGPISKRTDGFLSAPVDLCYVEEVREGEFPIVDYREVITYVSQVLIKKGLAKIAGVELVEDEDHEQHEEEDVDGEDIDSNTSTVCDEINDVKQWARPVPICDRRKIRTRSCYFHRQVLATLRPQVQRQEKSQGHEGFLQLSLR